MGKRPCPVGNIDVVLVIERRDVLDVVPQILDDAAHFRGEGCGREDGDGVIGQAYCMMMLGKCVHVWQLGAGGTGHTDCTSSAYFKVAES